MARRNVLILVVLLAFVAGGALAYNAWQDHQRAQAFEELINSPSCDTCAARKKNIADKQQQRKQESLARELSNSSAGDSQ